MKEEASSCMPFPAPLFEPEDAYQVHREPAPLESAWLHSRLKRLMDVVGASTLGFVFLPIIVVVAVFIARAGGPILFKQTRVGRGGRLFKVYKFRSMVPNAEEVLNNLLANDPELRREWAQDQKLKNDPRITRVGNFLRRTSLDELPQLLNILRGEMALVGPRPVIPNEIARYGRASRYYLAAKPGLTGFWQVTGRNDTDYFRRVALDRKYFERGSVWLDIFILWQTVWVVVLKKGAY